MNIINKNNKIYKYESLWRSSINENKIDSNHKPFPYPEIRNEWDNMIPFLHKLEAIQSYLVYAKKYEKSKKKDCLICNQKNITKGMYQIGNVYWEDGLEHYIEKHNIKPSEEFIDLISLFMMPQKSNIVRINSKKVKKINDIKYVEITRNQLHIIDALLRHGGYDKKYIDKHNNKIYRYSEHSGLLDFEKKDGKGLDKIIVSGKTTRVDAGDEEIFLPKDIKYKNYEYIFHTHPPTPKPGGRAKDGILYEVPSVSDILHFIDHFNDDKINGSIVIAPEGLYNIRKLGFNKNEIHIDEDRLYDKLVDEYPFIQEETLNKYGIEFTTYYFYSHIAQDKTVINKINEILKEYGLYIDYYPRTKDSNGTWIMDTVYLPIITK